MNYQVLKTYLITLAACALCACSNEDVVLSSSGAITFGQPIVNSDSDTRTTAESDIQTLQDEGFAVYGYNTTTDYQIFNKEWVTYVSDDNTWTYDNTQYRINANTYSFIGIAPYAAIGKSISDVDNTQISFSNSTAGGEVDLIAAFDAGASNEVSFTFNHLLSRLKVKVVNGYNEDGFLYPMEITSIKLTCNYESGNYNYSTSSWSGDTKNDHTLTLLSKSKSIASNTSGATDLNSITTDDYKYIIPYDDSNCTYTLEIAGYVYDTDGSTVLRAITYSEVISAADFGSAKGFKPGKSYLLSVKFKDKEATLDVDFEDMQSSSGEDWTHIYSNYFADGGDLSGSTTCTPNSKYLRLVEVVTNSDNAVTERHTKFVETSNPNLMSVTVKDLYPFMIYNMKDKYVNQEEHLYKNSRISSYVSGVWGAAEASEISIGYKYTLWGIGSTEKIKVFDFDTHKLALKDGQSGDVTLIFDMSTATLYVTDASNTPIYTSQTTYTYSE